MVRAFSARYWLLPASIFVFAACGGDDDGGPTEPPLDPDIFELQAVSGDGERGIIGSVVIEPMAARVVNRETSAPEEGATVTWRVVQGAATPTRSTSRTDEDGIATSRVEFGAIPGTVTMEASVNGLGSVTFDVTALRAPDLLSITPDDADPGDSVELGVLDLPDGMPVEVVFDGVEGDVVNVTPGSNGTVTAIVPPPAGVCDAEQDVPVRVRVGDFTTGSATLTVSRPANLFQVGQVLVMEKNDEVDEVQCALLPADGGSARYLLVALTTAFEQGGTFSVTLGSGDVTFSRRAGAAAETGFRSGPAGLHSRLRAMERELAALGVDRAQAEATRPQLFAQPELGSQREFWVLNSTEGQDADDFDRVTATLEFIGGNTLLYVDDRTPDQGLSPADIEFFGELYDRQLLDVDIDYFGAPSDVDRNGKVIVLLTPTVNSLTERGSEEVFIGFFVPLDLFSPNTPNCAICQFSNDAEMFYGIVPDPQGEFSDPRTVDWVKRLLPGIMVHETQHMINFRYKIFVNSALAPEFLWLAEGLAHTAEELAGDEILLAGDEELANDLYVGDLGRALRYLQSPNEHSLTVLEGGASVPTRGAAWLFMRWLAEQYGDFLMRDLTQARAHGVDNVQNQTGESFFRLFADWAVTLWADDQDIPGLAQRYQIPKWQLRDVLVFEPEEGADPIYGLQPEQQTFQEFRSNSIQEQLEGTTAFYVELDAAGDTDDLQLTLDAVTDAGLAVLRYE